MGKALPANVLADGKFHVLEVGELEINGAGGEFLDRAAWSQQRAAQRPIGLLLAA